jgi:hypothetical protein
MKGRTKALLAAGAILAAATAASAALGSVISTFYLSGTAQPYALGIYRDATYVYGVLYSSGATHLRSYTTAGTPVGSIPLGGAARGPGHSQLGAGYMGAVDNDRVVHYDISTGSRIASFSVASGARAYDYIPGGPYVYVATDRTIYCYTTTGSLVRVIPVASYVGGVAASRYVENRVGEYLIVGPWSSGMPAYVYSGGSLLRSFVVVGTTNGCVAGAGAPRTHGTTYWCNQYIGSGLYAYQLDLGNTNVGVAPASVGRIKAIYW